MISRGIGKSAARSVARSLSQFGSGGAAPPSYDTDAQAYITLVEAADGQSLETGVKDAINAFVVGCKSDGIWTAIKASCILAGARTLTGALVPLVGTAPMNNNFVSGDYNRKTGLVGDGATKYLDSNRASQDDPQNDHHVSVYIFSKGIDFRADIGSGSTGVEDYSEILNSFVLRSRNPNGATTSYSDGFAGISRSSSTSAAWRAGGSAGTLTQNSLTPNPYNYYVFARSRNGALQLIASDRLSFYSIGEALDLALLDSRVSTLMTAIGAAIP